MKRGTLVLGLCLLGVMAASQPARAEQYLPMQPTTAVAGDSAFYFSLGGQFRIIELPRFNSHVGIGTTTAPRLTEDPDVTTGGFALTVGRGVPLGLGQRPRLELGVGYLDGSSSTGFNYAFGAADVFRSIDGQVSGVQGGAGTSTNTLEADVYSLDLALRLKTDFPLGAAVTVSPWLGVVGGTGHLKYREDGFETFTATFNTNFTEARLRTNHFGGEVGADVAWRPADRLTVHGGVGFAVMGLFTRLNAEDCAGSSVAVRASACDGGTFRTSTSGSESTAAVRIGLSTGTNYDFAWGRVTLAGVFDWHSETAGVRVPTGGPAGVPSNGARIFYDDQISYGFIAAITIPLPF